MKQAKEQQDGEWHCCVGRSWSPETGPVTAPGTASVFAGFRFPREVISVAVRWYLRYGLSYRDVEELLAERGIESKWPGEGLFVSGDRPVRASHRRRRTETGILRPLPFFAQGFENGPRPAEVTTDRAPSYLRVLNELLPADLHVLDQYVHNVIEADHGKVEFRLRPSAAW
jgi:transposase, IS6 family